MIRRTAVVGWPDQLGLLPAVLELDSGRLKKCHGMKQDLELI
jgi:hypothetical protein